MRRGFALTFAAPTLFLLACSPQGQEENADDFASRIGATGDAPVPSQQDVAAEAAQPNAAAAQLPAGVDAKYLERLGDIAMVDLGPRTGGCTFQEVGREVFYVSGHSQGGKGVIRVGGQLVTVDAKGGLADIRGGTTYSASGVSISVAPAAGNQARRPANMVVTDAKGETQSYSGDWICG
ncbi:hypothetical protein WAB17_11525 [Parerythrobacter aurantius]|uniref:hypothetical protein n=1 Tax=Parerythrobacter aurantius TaxID=3127706 RepID=UPI003245B5A6